MVEQNHIACASCGRITEMGLEATLPVTVAKRGRTAGDGQLARHEKIVRHDIRGEVRQIAERERTQ